MPDGALCVRGLLGCLHRATTRTGRAGTVAAGSARSRAWVSRNRPTRWAPAGSPMCPLISGDGLFVFIVASPKQIDLKRRGAYALHSFPCPTNEDAFYVTGRAELVSTTVAAPGSRLSSLPSVRRWPWLCHLTTMRCSSSTSTRVCSRGRRGTAIQRRIDTSGTRSTSSSGGRHILPVGVVANVAALGDEHGPFGLGLLGG